MFDDFGFLTILMGVAFVAVSYDAIRHAERIFAEPATSDSRSRILRLVLFGLLPLSIIFHELGHAVAVWSFGGEVLDFGFYFYYGYVSFNAFGLSDLDLGLIAFAGPLVSVVIGLIALAVAWFWPRRTPVNYLLFLLGGLELANALVFYPVIDAVGGVGDGGDWSQIYSSSTPIFSGAVGVVHAAILIGAVVAWKSESFQRGYHQRTGQVYRTREETARRSDLAQIMARAATRAIDGWRHHVQLVADGQAGGIQAVLRWQSDGFHRSVVVHATPLDGSDPHVEIHAAIRAEDPGMPPYQRALTRINGQPNIEQLADHIRTALDTVDAWDGAISVN